MTAPLVSYSHPRMSFSLPLPQEWQQLTDPQQGVALIAVTPSRQENSFRTNAVVTVEEVADGDLAAWQANTNEQMERGLTEFVLLDEQQVDLGGWLAHRRLAHHRVEAYAVTLEQWAVLDQGYGYTLTCSAETWAYEDVAELFESIGRAFRVGSNLTT